MKLLSNKALRELVGRHPEAEAPLQSWKRIIEKSAFGDFAALRRSFRAVDKVGDKLVFTIGGNKWRLIAHVNFERKIVYVKAVLTHADC
ncbi:MAG: type II toxin-antitoxin system HigB family toxin, partial [Gammaproteobacteria bacterium]